MPTPARRISFVGECGGPGRCLRKSCLHWQGWPVLLTLHPSHAFLGLSIYHHWFMFSGIAIPRKAGQKGQSQAGILEAQVSLYFCTLFGLVIGWLDGGLLILDTDRWGPLSAARWVRPSDSWQLLEPQQGGNLTQCHLLRTIGSGSVLLVLPAFPIWPTLLTGDGSWAPVMVVPQSSTLK